ncbi:four helix bundle protein [uncultured Maribacter sp.]|uniref:four helix bundle protein n=1 Tax=uncultured Maribacter sp. TaxID=431308 RepID=UPI002638B172|nr:four helix bundle protein [uncultured Maribacter sp.]
MDYKELDVWLQVRKLVKSVYVITDFFTKQEQYELFSQIRRCAVSVASKFELETQLILANNLEYISSDLNSILNEVEREKLLNGFINYQKRI